MKKKVLSLLLVLAMMFSLGITAGAEEPAQDLSDSIIILHTNDVHGAIDGYAKAAALKKTYEDMGAYVLLVTLSTAIPPSAPARAPPRWS